MNKYLTKIASDLAKAEQYEKSEAKEVKMYGKEEKDADCPELKKALAYVKPQEKHHKEIFEKVVKDEKAYEKKASINIKPSHKGLLHKNMGVAASKPLSTGSLKAAESHAGPAEKKRIVFALNAKKFKH